MPIAGRGLSPPENHPIFYVGAGSLPARKYEINGSPAETQRGSPT